MQMNDMNWDEINHLLDDIFYDATKQGTPRVDVSRLRQGYRLVYDIRHTKQGCEVYHRLETKLKMFLRTMTTNQWIKNYDSYCRIIYFVTMFFYFIIEDSDINSLFYLFYSDYLSIHRNKWFYSAVRSRHVDRERLGRHVQIIQRFDSQFDHLDLYSQFRDFYLDDIQKEYHTQYRQVSDLLMAEYTESVMIYFFECRCRERDLSIGWERQEQMFLSEFIAPRIDELSTLFHDWLLKGDDRLRFCHDALCLHSADTVVTVYRKYLQTVTKLPLDSLLLPKLINLHHTEHERIFHTLENPSLHVILCQHWKEVFQTKMLHCYVRYLDREIRQNKEELTTEFLPFVVDKDVFVKEYYSVMTLRIVDNANIYMEEKALAVLQRHMGHSQTCAIDVLLRETWQSLRLQQQYGTNIHIFVWSRCYVPTERQAPYKIPELLQTAHQEYASFYCSKFGKLRLTPLFGAGRVWMKAMYASKRSYEFQMGEVQAHILLCLEQHHRLSEKELVQCLSEDSDADIAPYLESLQGIIHQEDRHWVLNPGFHSKKRFITVPRPKKRKSIDTDQSILSNRQFVVDSTIVRIMKSKRILAHPDLIIATSQSIQQFAPDVRFLKQRIESLIEKEYLERDPRDHRLYHYVL